MQLFVFAKMLFAGIWYARWKTPPPPNSASVGLIVTPVVLSRLAATAVGAPVTWEHSAVEDVAGAVPGGERAAAEAHQARVGRIVAAWVCTQGFARAVFEIDGPNVQRLIRSGILHSLSATHIVGQEEFLELALTRNPARPGCVIQRCVKSASDYIKEHPPHMERS